MPASLTAENTPSANAMSKTSKYPTILRRRLRIFSIGLSLLISSMCISYFTVRHLSNTTPPQSVGTENNVIKGNQLRADANDLVALLNAYLTRIPLDETAPRPSAYQWAQTEFRSSLNQYRMRISRNDSNFQETTHHLLDAANQCVTMAASPSDPGPRARAVARVKAATNYVEKQIDGLNVEQYLRQQRTRFQPSASR